jgi:uncharacterized membrane protein
MIAKYRRRLLIILTAFVIWSLVAIWLSFGLHVSHLLGQNRAFYFVLALAVVLPICAYYPMAKRVPRLAIALAVLSAGLVLISVGTISSFVFNLENVLTDRIFDLGQALLALACLIFIWQGVRARKGNQR